MLNLEQKSAVEHSSGPALIVAGAGTGKTTVIVNRILWLIQNKGLRSNRLLALTFTEKAAHEMEARVDELMPYGYSDLWIHTFHGFCERVLRECGLDMGLSTDFKLLNTTDQWILMRNNLDTFDLDYYRPLANPTRSIYGLLGHFSRCKDEMITPEQYLEYIEGLKQRNRIEELCGDGDHISKLSVTEKQDLFDSELKRISEIASAYQRYQNLLLENNYLDFGDILACTLKLFNGSPGVLSRYRAQFKHILVDEFQDTNTVQYELVKILAYPKNNLMVVGDDDQSIYRFRGASIQNIMQFKEDYPIAKEIILSINYRSGQGILDEAYKSIIHNNPYRLEEKLSINKKLKAHSDESAIIEHLHAKHIDDEVELVMKKILDIKDQNPDANWQDFAILSRANNHAGLFLHACERYKIPYNFIASKGLYLKPVILDVISYFKVLYNFHDDAAFYRILNIPSLSIAHKDIVEITHYAKKKGLSLYSVVKEVSAIGNISQESIIAIDLLLELFKNHSKLLQDKHQLSEVYVAFIRESGYLTLLTEKETIDNYYQLVHLEQFHKKIKALEQTNDSVSLKDFVEMMQLELEAGETGSLSNENEIDSDKVQVLTIHSSKGLEFKYVFIINMVAQRFPTSRRGDPMAIPAGLMKKSDLDESLMHIHEERRLFYVAITRAKQHLYFCSSDNYGGVRNKKLSLFLQELGYDSNIKKAKVEAQAFSSLEELRELPLANKPKYPLPQKFSFTQLKSFNTCPLLYKYKYILKIPTKATKNMSFGRSMHTTLESFFRIIQDEKASVAKQAGLFSSTNPALEEVVPTWHELLKIYEDSWIDHWYENASQQQEFKELGQEMLKGFYDGYIQNKPECFKIEQAFNVKFGDYTITGRIDRIDIDRQVGQSHNSDAQYQIIDYKTGAPREKISKEDKRQLILYQVAVEQLFDLAVNELTYYYLQQTKQLHFTASQKDRIDLKNWVISSIDSIRNSDFGATAGRHCQYCAFKDICEFKQA